MCVGVRNSEGNITLTSSHSQLLLSSPLNQVTQSMGWLLGILV